MSSSLDNCPCSGKNSSNLAAPWVLLTLYRHPSLHGYELTRIIRQHIEAAGMHMNMAGLYRHLNTLEQRGMLVSQWDTAVAGAPRRTYTLTANGTACLMRWMQTLKAQAVLIDAFLNEAHSLFPGQMASTPDMPGTPSPACG